MTDATSIIETIRILFQQQLFAVLATQEKSQPHTSLIGFAATDDLKKILFVTPRETRKYRNLLSNPFTSLLVDSRQNQERDFLTATAVTVYGSAQEAPEENISEYRDLYLKRYSTLHDFVHSPTSAVIVVSVSRYSMVSDFQSVQEVSFS